MRKIKELPKETFPIDEYDGYFISRRGIMYSCRGSGPRKPLPYYKIIKGSLIMGYRAFKPYGGKDEYIHRIMWRTFVEPIPKGMQINHINCNKQDNRLSNLELVTPKENMEHAVKMMLAQRGERNGMAKITKKDVKKIRKLWFETNLYHREIAEIFNISRENVGLIVRHQRWKHIDSF